VIHSLERVVAMVKEEPTFGQRIAKIQVALESLRNWTFDQPFSTGLVV